MRRTLWRLAQALQYVGALVLLVYVLVALGIAALAPGGAGVVASPR